MQAGLKRAQEALKAQEAAPAAAFAADINADGMVTERSALPRQHVDHEAAALQLESARVMQHANPGLQAPECAFIEASHVAERNGNCLHTWKMSILAVP